MIELDQATHKYFEVDAGQRRREIAGVSHILDVMGKKGKYYVRDDDDFYKTRGKFAHKAIALDQVGTLAEESVDPQIKEYVRGWREFKIERHVVVLATEHPFYNEALDYCGTLDLVALIEGFDLPFVLDAKSGSPAPWHELQVAAYVLGHGRARWREFNGGVLYLRQTGRYKLSVIPPVTLARRIDEWGATVRDFHQKESRIWL